MDVIVLFFFFLPTESVKQASLYFLVSCTVTELKAGGCDPVVINVGFSVTHRCKRVASSEERARVCVWEWRSPSSLVVPHPTPRSQKPCSLKSPAISLISLPLAPL